MASYYLCHRVGGILGEELYRPLLVVIDERVIGVRAGIADDEPDDFHAHGVRSGSGFQTPAVHLITLRPPGISLTAYVRAAIRRSARAAESAALRTITVMESPVRL